jgi:hypothetical protein
VYNSVVDAPNWGASIPGSIRTAREYSSRVNPGHFYRVVAPLTQVLAIVAPVLAWKSAGHVRIFLGVAAAMLVLADVLTFAYFYPRNHIMFEAGSDPAQLSAVWREWSG